MTEETRDAHTDHRNRRRGYIQLVLIVIFVGGAFLGARYLASLQTTPSPEKETQERKLLVETARIVPGSHRLEFSTTGTVQVRAMTNIVPQVSGRIVHIDENAFPGGVIDADTILFTIEKTDFRLRVKQVKAEIARAERQLELQEADAKASVAEWRRLNAEQPVPPLVAKEPQLGEARAALRAAKAQLELARLDLSRTDFQLPFTGRVTELGLEEGQYVVAGQSYGKAYRVASLEVDVPLAPKERDWLDETESPIITVSSEKGEEYPGFVKRTASTVDERTRLSRAILGIDHANPKLVPGVFVEVHIIGPMRRNVWTLPLNALQEGGTIWVVTSDNTLKKLQPEILQISKEHVIAKSDGRTISVVQGNLPDATENAAVQPVKQDISEDGDHGQRE